MTIPNIHGVSTDTFKIKTTETLANNINNEDIMDLENLQQDLADAQGNVFPLEDTTMGNENIPQSNGGFEYLNNEQTVQPAQQMPQQEAQAQMPVQEEKKVEKKPEPPKEKEYSTEQFRKDYNNILNTTVMPIMAQYEDERKKRFMMALAASGALGFLAVICLFSEFDKEGRLMWLCIGGAVAAWAGIKKSFEKKVKKRVMPLLMQAVPGFNWTNETPIKNEEIVKSSLFNVHKKSVGIFDDCFTGLYRNVPITMSECSYSTGSKFSNNERIFFKGVIIKIKMNKNFTGVTVVRPKKADSKDMKKAKLEKVELEDINFTKKYQVFSTDQVEARYLLTTTFIERMMNIYLAFNANDIYCVFRDDYVYIAPFIKKDLFDLCRLTRPITDKSQFETLLSEFISILELVDYFKLDQKLGL